MLWGDNHGESEEVMIEKEKKLVEQCESNVKSFNDCLENNNNDIGQCQYYFNELNRCKKEKVDSQFEQA